MSVANRNEERFRLFLNYFGLVIIFAVIDRDGDDVHVYCHEDTDAVRKARPFILRSTPSIWNQILLHIKNLYSAPAFHAARKNTHLFFATRHCNALTVFTDRAL